MATFQKKFAPPHCPNPKCLHRNGFTNPRAFKRAGYFRRQHAPMCIQRFTCKFCNRSFSTQTFSMDYWQNMAVRLFFKVVGGMANRQIARDLRVSPSTVDHHISRMARHCLLFHQRTIAGQRSPDQLVIDGFESFEWSQFHPIHLHLAVEKGNDFFWYFTDSPLRRKGRMTSGQRRRRAALDKLLGRPDPKAIEKDTRELLQVVLSGLSHAVVYCDCHPAYARAMTGLKCHIEHDLTPGSEHRDQNNSLWEVNLTDLFIRHCSSNHKRETIAWSKRRHELAYGF